jgi:hypothetical protein
VKYFILTFVVVCVVIGGLEMGLSRDFQKKRREGSID